MLCFWTSNSICDTSCLMHLPGVCVGWEAPGECCCGATEAQTVGFPLTVSQVEKGHQNVCFVCSEIEQKRTCFFSLFCLWRGREERDVCFTSTENCQIAGIFLLCVCCSSLSKTMTVCAVCNDTSSYLLKNCILVRIVSICQENTP